MRKNVFEAALAGLMHDFGKIDRSAEGHPSRGHDAVVGMRDALRKSVGNSYGEASLDSIVDQVTDLVEHHHDQAPPSGADRCVFYALKFADWLASNYREDEEVMSGAFRAEQVASPFYPLRGVLDHWQIFASKRIEPSALRKIIIDVLQRANSSNDVILAILRTLYKEAYHIPDAVKDGTIPLPVHCHLVSAIASAMVGTEDFCKAIENIEGDVPAKEVAQYLSSGDFPVFDFVAIDIHKIQKFIYSFRSESGAMRTVAGKSMLINVLSHLLPYIVADLYGGSPTGVLVNSGGKSLLVVPHRENMDPDNLAKEITRSLWRAGIRVVVSVKSVSVSSRDLFSALSVDDRDELNRVMQGAITELWDRLRSDIAHYFVEAQILNDLEVNPDVSVADGSREVCPRCGTSIFDVTGLVEFDDQRSGDFPLCSACRLAEVFRNILVIAGEGRQNGDVGVSFALKNIHSRDYRIRVKNSSLQVESEKYLFTLTIGENGDIPIPAFYLRRDGSLVTLEDFGDVFAVAKGDGDSMGALFSWALKDGLPNYVALSYSISNFFERVLPERMRSRDYNAHLIYAGGDDFLLVGDVSSVFDAVLYILSAFEHYKRYGSVPQGIGSSFSIEYLPSVSVGISVFPKKYKILWAINRAEDLLSAAKRAVVCDPGEPCMKARVAIQAENYVISVEDLPSVLKDARTIASDVSSERVTRQTFYKALDRGVALVSTLVEEGSFGRESVRRYSEFRHYLNRLSKKSTAKVVQVSDRFLTAVLSSVGTGVHADSLYARLAPFVVAYLLMKSALGGESGV